MKGRFLFALCLVACSSESPSNNGGTDASNDATADVIAQEAGNDAGTDAPQEAGDDATTACNALVNVGTVIPMMFEASDPVTGTGGVIANGTYVLTAAVAYAGPDGGAGPTGMTFQDTLAMNSGSYERVVAVTGAGFDGSPVHQNGNYELNGSSIKVTMTCPPGPQPFNSYSSDGTKVQIFAPAAGPGNPALMFEYTKK